MNEDIAYAEDPLLFDSSKLDDCFDTNWFQFDESNCFDNDNNAMLLNEEYEMQSINLSEVGSPKSQINDVHFE